MEDARAIAIHSLAECGPSPIQAKWKTQMCQVEAHQKQLVLDVWNQFLHAPNIVLADKKEILFKCF